MKHEINYHNQHLTTELWAEATPEEMNTARKEFYAKPALLEVIRQCQVIARGGVANDKITRYFFRDLMAKTQVKTAKWTVEDVFNYLDLFCVFKAKVERSPKTFDPSCTLSYNITRAISLGGKSYAQIPTNFPIKAADNILKKYCPNNNVYDFSCGWGARLTAYLKHKLNYFGTDPNTLLVERLNEFSELWCNNISNKSTVDIRAIGSEIYVPEWKNQIGLAFSSPPYFDLEDYKIGEQSIKTNLTYEDWLNNYFCSTIDNISHYLIDNGFLAINIKNIDGYPLAVDFKRIIESKGYKLIAIEPLKQIKRVKSCGGLVNTTDENIYVFQKIN